MYLRSHLANIFVENHLRISRLKDKQTMHALTRWQRYKLSIGFLHSHNVDQCVERLNHGGPRGVSHWESVVAWLKISKLIARAIHMSPILLKSNFLFCCFISWDSQVTWKLGFHLVFCRIHSKVHSYWFLQITEKWLMIVVTRDGGYLCCLCWTSRMGWVWSVWTPGCLLKMYSQTSVCTRWQAMLHL